MIQNDDYDYENSGQNDDLEDFGDFFEQESDDDASNDQTELIIISKSDKTEVDRIAKSLSAGGSLSPNDYAILKRFATYCLQSILLNRGQKINRAALGDMIQDSITSFWQHITTHHGEVLDNAAGYIYTVCRSVIYKIKVAQPNKVYDLFRRRFTETIKKLENEGKIHSHKEKRAATPEKLRVSDGIDDISPRSVAAEFDTNLLIKEEQWTTERMLELENLLLYILNRIEGSITVSQLEKCIADRIYIKQDAKISINPTDRASGENEVEDRQEHAVLSTLPEEYSDPDSDIYFQKFREELEDKIHEIAGSKKVAKKVLKAWHYYNFEEKTFEEVAEKFGYAGASGAETAVKNQCNDILNKYIHNKLDKIALGNKHREIMEEIIMNDLDRIIPGL